METVQPSVQHARFKAQTAVLAMAGVNVIWGAAFPLTKPALETIPPFTFALLRFVLVAIILILPTTAMGATLPILAEGVVKKSDQLAGKTGLLYAANTFGAVAGSFTAGFLFIPNLGISTTVYLAAAIDLFVAITVLLLFKLSGESLLLRSVSTQTSPRRTWACAAAAVSCTSTTVS